MLALNMSFLPCLQAEVTQRLANAKELASKPAGLHSHEDLAKKLKVVMFRISLFCISWLLRLVISSSLTFLSYCISLILILFFCYCRMKWRETVGHQVISVLE